MIYNLSELECEGCGNLTSFEKKEHGEDNERVKFWKVGCEECNIWFIPMCGKDHNFNPWENAEKAITLRWNKGSGEIGFCEKCQSEEMRGWLDSATKAPSMETFLMSKFLSKLNSE